MSKYEYIRLAFDFGDLKELNSFGNSGWRVVTVQRMEHHQGDEYFYALLERRIA